MYSYYMLKSTINSNIVKLTYACIIVFSSSLSLTIMHVYCANINEYNENINAIKYKMCAVGIVTPPVTIIIR